jgi:hypothetical protein
VDGNATFNGAAAGTFSSPTLSGNLLAEDFEFTVPATSRTPGKPVHWDSLAASLQLSSHELSLRGGSLRRGDTSADFEVNATLQNGQFAVDSPYTARVTLHNVDVASTAALAGFDYPISGTADVGLQIAGTRARPQAQGTFMRSMHPHTGKRLKSSMPISASGQLRLRLTTFIFHIRTRKSQGMRSFPSARRSSASTFPARISSSLACGRFILRNCQSADKPISLCKLRGRWPALPSMPASMSGI